MTRKALSSLTLQLMLVSASAGAAVAEGVEGTWAQNPAKILVAVPFAVLAGLFANRVEDNLLDEFNGRR